MPCHPPRPPRARAARAEEPTPMAPIALTLAIWLGAIASVTCLVRVSENAALQAALQQQTQMQQHATAVQPELRPAPAHGS